MAKRTTAKRKAAAASEAVQDVSPLLREAPVGRRLLTKITWQLQVQVEDSAWDEYGTPTDDREALQRTQDFRAREFPEERRRVVEHQETWVVVDIEEPGRDPGPLPEADMSDPGDFWERLGTKDRRR